MNRKVTIGVLTLGLLIHIYVVIYKFEGPLSLEYSFLSMLPYSICFIIFILHRNSMMPFAGSIVPLIVDSFTYYSVFIKSAASTGAFLWTSVFNTALFMPVGLLFGISIDSWKKKASAVPNNTLEQTGRNSRRIS